MLLNNLNRFYIEYPISNIQYRISNIEFINLKVINFLINKCSVDRIIYYLEIIIKNIHNYNYTIYY